jgi:TaqI-like C-terminal specificity domain
MGKMRTTGLALRDFIGTGPLYGVKTGCNEAFIVDTHTRDKLVAEHQSSADLLKKYLRGQDIDRWSSQWSGEWMIFTRRGVEIDCFPAIKKHLEKYRTQLEPKPKNWSGENWPGRASGSYKWFELQMPVEYWPAFERPKIVYPDITWRSSFSYDATNLYANNTIYFLPSGDFWLLAVLNSPIIWWYSWRAAQHTKDEALRFFTAFVEACPIPSTSDSNRKAAE